MAEQAQSECRGWKSIADLVGDHPAAPAALVGAPLGLESLTPGQCDLGPETIRRTLRRFSVFDLESELDLSAMRVRDYGDADIRALTPAQAFAPLRDAVSRAVGAHTLAIVVGGNNAVTRPGVHGAGDLKTVGLLTLDAHFDLRDTDCGLTNGNPVRALIEDGLPGENIAQIGLAPFANTRRAFEFARSEGIMVRTIAETKSAGIEATLDEALDALSHCERIYVDFDIDVIDRSQCPGAPGARPGGLSVDDFFVSARRLAAAPRVVAVDLTEFDPALDLSHITALTAGRWFCEILAGLSFRHAP
jgi:formiminoglutamase